MKEKLSINQAEILRPYYAKSVDKGDFIKMIEAGGVSKNEKNITSGDLFSTPENIGREGMLKLIASILNIKPEENSDRDEKNSNNLEKIIKEKLNDISKYFNESKDYYKNYLNIKIPKTIDKIDGFKTVQDLINFISKTTTLKKGENVGLSPYYCAIVSRMIVFNEYYKENFQTLKQESEYVDKKLFKDSDEEGTIKRFNKIKKTEDKNWDEIGIIDYKGSWLKALYSYRGKDKESSITKIGKEPGLDANEVIKDGIGLKFEVSRKEEVLELIEFLSRYVTENFETSSLILENRSVLDDSTMETLKKILKEYNIACVNHEFNASSSEKFQDIRIRGEITIPEKGEQGLKEERMMRKRKFEIQIVLTDNKNETGLVQHGIYKRVQKLSAYTRDFGSFSEDYLDLICEEASQATNISKKRVKEYLLKKLVKVNSRLSRKRRYASKEHIDRWQKTDLMPDDIQVLKK